MLKSRKLLPALRKLILHPVTAALAISLLIIVLLPPHAQKYTLTLQGTENIALPDKIYYADLDSDGVSEKILTKENSIGAASYMLYYDQNHIIDQWNLGARFLYQGHFLFFLDADHDGCLEIVNATQKGDSLFINYVEPLDPEGVDQRRVFVDTMEAMNGQFDPAATEVMLYPEVASGQDKYVFTFNLGFSGNPRSAYRVDPVSQTVEKSPHLTNKAYVGLTRDVDEDRKAEILMVTYSACNDLDSALTPKSDYSSWITVLDDDLGFLFPQVEIPSPYSGVAPLGFHDSTLYYMVRSRRDDLPSSIAAISPKGELLESRELGITPVKPYYTENGFVLHDMGTGQVLVFPSFTSEGEPRQVLPNAELKSLDLDDDGQKEWLGIDLKQNELRVYDGDFENAVGYQFPVGQTPDFRMGRYFSEDGTPRLWVQMGEWEYDFQYTRNPMYSLKYALYLAIFLGVLALVLGIMKLQSEREKQQRRIETQIAELQLKTIKNKVDPHFVFNSLNAISEMTLTDNKMEADAFISAFAALMRKTLHSSDRIAHTLAEELDFVQHYAALQRVRYQKEIDLQLFIDPTLDDQVLVPKHIFFTYVENAIKHGMGKGGSPLRIRLSATPVRNGIRFVVEDNAGGMGASDLSEKFSTRSGLKTMELILELFQKLNKRKTRWRYENFQDPDTGEKGLRVEIVLMN
jgi:two-component sensor histidine kinase